MRIIVVGASSGLGRCIGIGLGRRGDHVALMARRSDLLTTAQSEAGATAMSITCDVTDPASCASATAEAVERLGGIDALIYTPAISPLSMLVDTDVDLWRRVFDTNVVGAALMTTTVLPHLVESHGRAVYLSSIIAGGTPPWPGLGAYAVSKAALDKLVEAWRVEHPEIGFTRFVVGDCVGGEGDAQTQMSAGWNLDLAAEMVPIWLQRNYMNGSFVDVEDLVAAMHGLLRTGPTVSMASVTVSPRPAPAP